MSIVVIVECIYLIYKLTDKRVRHASQIFSYLPLIVCGLLIVCVAYNAAAIAFNIFKFTKSKKGSSIDKEEDRILGDQ
jgi:hypothetical protein